MLDIKIDGSNRSYRFVKHVPSTDTNTTLLLSLIIMISICFHYFFGFFVFEGVVVTIVVMKMHK